MAQDKNQDKITEKTRCWHVANEWIKYIQYVHRRLEKVGIVTRQT